MTASEKIRWLRSLPGETISPQALAKVAGGNAYSYNVAAKEGKLDLPHLWRGRNLRIWKGPVIRLIGGENVQAISDGRRKADEGQDDEGRDRGSAWFQVINCPVRSLPGGSPVGSDLTD